MISFAAMKLTGASTVAAGSRYGRRRPVSALRKASNATGAKPYMIIVAEVMKLTNSCQLGNGRKQITPTTKLRKTEPSGTPRSLILLSGRGRKCSALIAKDNRDDVAVEAGAVPAGEREGA